jgi:hypothetical protein
VEAEHFGIDLNSVRTTEDLRHVLAAILTAVARGEIAPAEALRIARRAEAGLVAVDRRARSCAAPRLGTEESQRLSPDPFFA